MKTFRLHHVTLVAAFLLNQSLNALAVETEARKVTITFQDLTGTQPASSSAWISHTAKFRLWEEGKPATLPIKRLAEEGNPEFILGTAFFDQNNAFRDEAVALPALPGQGRTVTLDVDAAHPFVSGGWMLGMTNDGFAGVTGVDAFHLNAPMTVEVFALDAGTRKNSEKKAHTAAFGGIEEDAENGVVSRHTGIRGDADIPSSFKFDASKPVGRVTITTAAIPRS